MKQIKLGYEIETGKEVGVSLSHLIVTGVTQLSGKTTTLEALIKRSELKAIVFKTKIGENSFTQGTEVPPFFRDRSDYEFVKSLIEAYNREKLFLEKGTLMGLCKGTSNLIEIKKRVDDKMAEGKLRGIQNEIYTRLQHYLEQLIPQIQYGGFSNTLTIYDGINIMNLERLSEEAQSLVIQAVADEVLKTQKGIILVIPEAWKFIPQKYNNPCKRVVESYIRQGAANKNFIWIDSQDMAGVDKTPLKQLSTWILGYQSERNEVKHTLDQIALPAKSKPKEDEIMNLRKGHFIVSSYDGVKRVYVQPIWMADKQAKEIAMGKKNVDEITAPTNLVPLARIPQKQEYSEVPQSTPSNSNFQKELVELRMDFFAKLSQMESKFNEMNNHIINSSNNRQEINVDAIVAKVLQKMPSSTIGSNGTTTYEVAPLQALKRKFMEEAKEKILGSISSLPNDSKKVLKYLEAKQTSVRANELIEKCFFLKPGGSSASKVSTAFKALKDENFGAADGNGYKGTLSKRIDFYLGESEATEAEKVQLYNHIIMELVK